MAWKSAAEVGKVKILGMLRISEVLQLFGVGPGSVNIREEQQALSENKRCCNRAFIACPTFVSGQTGSAIGLFPKTIHNSRTKGMGVGPTGSDDFKVLCSKTCSRL